MPTQHPHDQLPQPSNRTSELSETACKKAFVKPTLEQQESLPKITFGSNIFGDGGQEQSF